jgi:hypothetical protein
MDSEYNINLKINGRLTIKTYKCKEVLVQDESYHKIVNSLDFVAILYAPGYGGTWSAHIGNTKLKKQMVLDSRLIKYVTSSDFHKKFKSGQVTMWQNNKTYLNLIQDIFSNKLESESIPDVETFAQLTVGFIPNNTLFRINEYDGSESVEILHTYNYIMS